MPQSNQSQRVIIVTGASSGIGKTTAKQLIAEGHVVYGAARRLEKMQDLVEAGGHALKLDVTDMASVKEAVARVKSEQGRIDVLINNAGYAVYGSVEDVDLDDARRQFEVNIFGLAAITREVLPTMRAQGQGKIINVSSVGGKIYSPLGAWYHATKHALEGWSDCLRIEVKQFGIDVVIVEPGAIETEFGDVMMQPMLDRSKDGPYLGMAESIVRGSENFYNGAESARPEVIAQTMSKIVGAKRVKTRYHAGRMATTVLTARRLLSDRQFDRMVLSMLK